MTAVKAITDTLKAMGANPIIKISKDGKSIEIKINAPTVPTPTAPGEGGK